MCVHGVLGLPQVHLQGRLTAAQVALVVWRLRLQLELQLELELVVEAQAMCCTVSCHSAASTHVSRLSQWRHEKIL